MSPLVVEPWGRHPRVEQRVRPLPDRFAPLPLQDGTSALPFGLGRSYGDSCLNPDGVVVTTECLNGVLDVDTAARTARVEAGVSLHQLLQHIVPKGLFLPVTPGTRHVTVGGAIANDVHGKNHHVAGTFGRHVRRLELLRSSGERVTCSPTQEPELFSATIAGMGLTGLITWADIDLIPIESPFINVEEIPLANLDAFFAVDAESTRHAYTVAWIDAQARGADLGRGVYFRGDHASGVDAPRASGASTRAAIPWSVPFDFPSFALSRPTIQAFNALYRFGHRKRRSRVQHYQPFFYPLDAVDHWNRCYGARGFLQYQSVVPRAHARDVCAALLKEVGDSGSGSFLAVLKVFGDLPSPGLMSFPRPGVTLAVDLPLEGARTFALCDRLDAIVAQADGALYPAKDARMSPSMFQRGFPQWRRFASSIDPRFSSRFWQRVAVS